MTKLVCGVGVYEKGKYAANEIVDGNSKITKVYNTWHSMLERGYCLKVKLKFPTYQGVTVCNDWLNFQTFAEWYNKQQFANKIDYHLDKDLLVSCNKIPALSGVKTWLGVILQSKLPVLRHDDFL